MALVKVEVEVSKEAQELGSALAKLVVAVKAAVERGFNPMVDLPLILGGNLPSILAGVEGLDKLGDELSANPSAFAKAWALTGADIAAAFIKKA